jgi:ABC-type phosphate/phosphonate transport system substrate-binding protein
MVSISITVEQLITAVQQLQPDERAQVAQALIQADLRSDLTALIQELYAAPPVSEITDDDIESEVKAVRQRSQPL